MGSDRQIIADQILKAIDYGNLPKDEIERRLEQIIDTELNVPLNAEVNQEKVDLCNSLLHQLYTHGKFEYNDSIEESKQKVIRKLNARKRRAIALKYAIRSIAAALILVVGLSLLNVLPPIRWFTGTSTDDEQQYVVQGHVISTQTIANAIAEHEGNDSYVADSEELVNEYLGFDIGLPSTIFEKYQVQTFFVSILPEYITIISDYTYTNTKVKDEITIIKTLFTDIENAYIPFEQDKAGEMIQINDLSIYKYVNVNRTSFLWIDGNTLYNVVTSNQPSASDGMLDVILKEIYQRRDYK